MMVINVGSCFNVYYNTPFKAFSCSSFGYKTLILCNKFVSNRVHVDCNETKVAGRILLGDYTGYGAVHTAADHVPSCWSLEFDWTALYAHARVTARVLSSDLCKALLARNSPARNCNECLCVQSCYRVKFRVK